MLINLLRLLNRSCRSSLSYKGQSTSVESDFLLFTDGKSLHVSSSPGVQACLSSALRRRLRWHWCPIYIAEYLNFNQRSTSQTKALFFLVCFRVFWFQVQPIGESIQIQIQSRWENPMKVWEVKRVQEILNKEKTNAELCKKKWLTKYKWQYI